MFTWKFVKKSESTVEQQNTVELHEEVGTISTSEQPDNESIHSEPVNISSAGVNLSSTMPDASQKNNAPKQKDNRLFKNKDFNMCLKILSFVWSADLLREFLNLYIDYTTFSISPFMIHLSWKQKVHLAFLFAVVVISFFCSFICQLERNYIDRLHLTLAYLTFSHVVYFFRITILYREFTWLWSDLTECVNGHVLTVSGMWYLFHLNEKQNMENNRNPSENRNSSTTPSLETDD